MNSLASTNNRRLSTRIPRHFVTTLVGCFILLAICIMASFIFGSRAVSFQDLVDGLIYQNSDSYGAHVVHKRISRTIFSVLCGAALGISGALMQAVTRNPIADPSILGVNTGASLFVVCGIAFFNISTAHQYIWMALIGAVLTAIFVFGISYLGRGGATPLKLVLAGAATSAILSSLVVAIMIPRANVMDEFRFWQVGSVGAANENAIMLFLPFFIIGTLIGVISTTALNALALGDEIAKGLGVRTGTLRIVAAFAAVLLCGAATALAGPIGFVGLLSTHVIRLVLGPDMRFIIPMSAVTGAIILTISDVLGRVIGSPGELEVGVVTAFIGAPILILLARKVKVQSL